MFFLKLYSLFPFQKEDGPSLIIFKLGSVGVRIGAQLEKTKQTNIKSSTFTLLPRKNLKPVWIIFGGVRSQDFLNTGITGEGCEKGRFPRT